MTLSIETAALAKTYRIYRTPRHRLWQMLWPGKRQFYTPFEALKPLDIAVEKGSMVGIVGRNGSGKSTLLQMLAGTLTPSSGHFKAHGRIAALLELGAGFNPDFTGRENVKLNAAILGMSQQEIETSMQDILGFANIGEFIDRPVSTYSSGMVVRLAFAVATAAQPEILIVDEALSVGDEAFQRKCFSRIDTMRKAGTTILFVSHSSQLIVQLCDRAIWLDKGDKLMDDSPKAVIEHYQRFVSGNESERQQMRASLLADQSAMGKLVTSQPQQDHGEQQYPSHGAVIRHPQLVSAEDHQPVETLEQGRDYIFRYELAVEKAIEQARCGMMIKTRTGLEVAGAVQRLAEQHMPKLQPGQVIEVSFHFRCLLYPQVYFFNAGAIGTVKGEERFLHRRVDVCKATVVNPGGRNRHGVAPQGITDLDFRAELTPL
jgi:lipopolysaccharide transport system ATP-binding protein